MRICISPEHPRDGWRNLESDANLVEKERLFSIESGETMFNHKQAWKAHPVCRNPCPEPAPSFSRWRLPPKSGAIVLHPSLPVGCIGFLPTTLRLCCYLGPSCFIPSAVVTLPRCGLTSSDHQTYKDQQGGGYPRYLHFPNIRISPLPVQHWGFFHHLVY